MAHKFSGVFFLATQSSQAEGEPTPKACTSGRESNYDGFGIKLKFRVGTGDLGEIVLNFAPIFKHAAEIEANLSANVMK